MVDYIFTRKQTIFVRKATQYEESHFQRNIRHKFRNDVTGVQFRIKFRMRGVEKTIQISVKIH